MCVVAMLISPVKKAKLSFQNNIDTPKQSSKSFVEQTRIIYRNYSFLLMSLNSFFLGFTASVVFTHVAAYVRSVGLSSHWENIIISVLGGAGIGE